MHQACTVAALQSCFLKLHGSDGIAESVYSRPLVDQGAAMLSPFEDGVGAFCFAAWGLFQCILYAFIASRSALLLLMKSCNAAQSVSCALQLGILDFSTIVCDLITGDCASASC
jgi:hypothetical protein